MPEHELDGVKVSIFRGDITEQAVDAVVNAANNDLQLGAGVAGAIRRRGGPSIQAECDRIGPIEVGQAALTRGGELPARYVLHAASMHLGGRTTRESLHSSMDHVFRLAVENGIRTLAIPAVGTGVARLPMRDCAEVMADCLLRAVAGGRQFEEVRFVLFDEEAAAAFDQAWQQVLGRSPA